MLRLSKTLITLCLVPFSAQAEAPHVATDIAPIYALVQAVMTGISTPDLIMPVRADPHSYAMRPSEALALERADIIFWVGEVLTPWLSGPISTLAPDAEIIALSNTPGTTRLSLKSGGGIDPHLWLDPNNALLWLSEISHHLVNADPENRAIYLQNTVRIQGEIEALIPKITDQLAPFAFTKYVTYHDSFGYFGNAFNITPFGSITDGDSSLPDTAKLIAYPALLAENDITCLLTEPGASVAIVANMTPENVNIVEAYPLGISALGAPDYYQRLILDLAQALTKCLTKSD